MAYKIQHLVNEPQGNKPITDTSVTNVAEFATAQVTDSNLTAENIAKDVVVLGITGTHATGAGGNYNIVSTENPDGSQNLAITDATSGTTEELNVTTNGNYVKTSGGYNPVNVNVPTGPAKSSSDLTVSGATVTAPAGLYAANASASVASGTQGTPVAIKGIVSNNSVIVTPSATDTTGYIEGTTKSGDSVTVSASELVSGNKELQSSASEQTSIDVTNYATVSVAAIPTSPLDDTIISGQAYEEATGDYAWKSTVQVPAGYHAAQTIEKTFSEIFPAPETPGTASEVLLGYQFFDKDGKKVTGTMANNGAVTNTISTQGGTYTIPTGYHNGSGVVTAQLAAGTQGDITLNKSISSNTATISASQTDTTGYITGTTKTGSTTVSASELVSGNVNITNTSSVDVTNYATAQINDANLIADNIKYGVTVLGIAGQAKGIDEVATVPTTKTTDVIKCTTDGYYYAWED